LFDLFLKNVFPDACGQRAFRSIFSDFAAPKNARVFLETELQQELFFIKEDI
jgi:hypothetical protein